MRFFSTLAQDQQTLIVQSLDAMLGGSGSSSNNP
jgi:hypothetical protein